MKSAFLVLFGLGFFLACGIPSASNLLPDPSDLLQEEEVVLAETKTVSEPGYSLEIPVYLKETTDLNEDASMQYQNPIKETYFVVIDEPKDVFIEIFKEGGFYVDSLSPIQNYANFQSESLLETLVSISEESELVFSNRFGLPVADFSVSGISEDLPDYGIHYILGYVEGAKTMYTIMAWTLESRAKRYGPDLQALVESFREIN